MALVRAMMRLAAIAIFIHMAKAKSYAVGAPNGGWELNTPLQAWANLNTFFVGDSLRFVYTPSHDVVEVTKEDYDLCIASNPIQFFLGGNSVISLTTSGERYFICGIPSHCDRGMKVVISTLSPPSLPETPPQTTSSSAASPPPAMGSTSSPAPSSEDFHSISPSNSPFGNPLKISPSSSPATGISSIPEDLAADSPLLAPFQSVPSPSSEPSSADKFNGISGFITMGFGFMIILLILPL